MIYFTSKILIERFDYFFTRGNTRSLTQSPLEARARGVFFVVIGACSVRRQMSLAVTQQQQHNAEPENRPALRGRARAVFISFPSFGSPFVRRCCYARRFESRPSRTFLAGRFVTHAHTRHTPARSVCIQTKDEPGHAPANSSRTLSPSIAKPVYSC